MRYTANKSFAVRTQALLMKSTDIFKAVPLQVWTDSVRIAWEVAKIANSQAPIPN